MKTDEQLITDWKKHTINIGDHKVIYVTDTFVDCFFNSGWADCTRIKVNKFKGTFRFLNGRDSSNRRLDYLVNQIIGSIK